MSWTNALQVHAIVIISPNQLLSSRNQLTADMSIEQGETEAKDLYQELKEGEIRLLRIEPGLK